MPGIYLFAVFSYCAFKLAIKRIYKSILIFCIDLGWLQNYPQLSTQVWVFCGYFFACK